MSKLDGITRKRRKVEEYKNFDIIEVIAIHHWYSSYDRAYRMTRQYETRREKFYEFCDLGNSNRPSLAYSVYPYPKTISEIKACIDDMLEGKEMYFTDAEREKYVYKPNRECQWGYGYDSLMRIMRQHQKADKRMKRLLEDRLEDANFHGECGLLSMEDYEGFKNHVTEHYTFNEKFIIMTHTHGGGLKSCEKLTEGIKKAIEDYIMSVGEKDTEVEVSYVKEW